MPKPARRAASGGEFELIAQLTRELSPGSTAAVELGIGDDAAVLRGLDQRRRLVVSVDDQVQGVHFDLRWLGAEDVGFRSLQAAAS
ncbi:MAG TPA: hypothetical protein VIW29_01970, partial [Polyangiaceae bacterium]